MSPERYALSVCSSSWSWYDPHLYPSLFKFHVFLCQSSTIDASHFNRTDPQWFWLFYLGYLKHSTCWSINPTFKCIKLVLSITINPLSCCCQNSKNHIHGNSEMLMEFWANPKGWKTIWSHFCFWCFLSKSKIAERSSIDPNCSHVWSNLIPSTVTRDLIPSTVTISNPYSILLL